MNEWRTGRKGAGAEAEITAAAIRLELPVLRPVAEGGRYDLAIDVGERMLRVQCKWASRIGDVLDVCRTKSRHTPRGYIKTTYSANEIDAIAAYSPDTDRCYLIPIEEAAGMVSLSLRVGPTRNNQATNVRWARDYGLETVLRRSWGAGRHLVVIGHGRSRDHESIR